MDKPTPPKVENAPGIVWKRRKNEWVSIWQPRTDLVERGYPSYIHKVWRGEEPGEIDRQYIADQCTRLQTAMLIWGQGGLNKPERKFDGTLNSLIICYQTDSYSRFPKLEYKTREHYCQLMKRIIADHGHERVVNIKARHVMRWHEDWTPRGAVMARAVIRMLRVLFSFGATILECDECERLCVVMSNMRFKMTPRRSVWLTAEQVIAIRDTAHQYGLHSIALAQAIQFEVLLRQKDVIGEWVPVAEKGTSDIINKGQKWVKGIRWSEIDQNLILRHTTSKRQKDLEVDLKLAPMVMEEFALLGERPTSGPIIISEYTGRAWRTVEFRRKWRIVANAAGIPKGVRNMDSRAGGITEASNAGAPMESIRHAATHSDIQTTQGYSRGSSEKIASVMQLRVAHRKNASKT